MKLEWIKSDALSEADIFWLVRGCLRCNWTEISPAEMVRRAQDGVIGLYRISGEAEGIVVASQRGDALFIELLSGKNFFSHFPEVRRLLQLAASSAGFSKLTGFVSRDGFARLLKRRTAATPLAVLYSEDI